MARPGMTKGASDAIAVYDLDLDMRGLDFGSGSFAKAIDVAAPAVAEAARVTLTAASDQLTFASVAAAPAVEASTVSPSVFALPGTSAVDPGATLKAGLLTSSFDHGTFIAVSAYTDPMTLMIKPAEVLTG